MREVKFYKTSDLKSDILLELEQILQTEYLKTAGEVKIIIELDSAEVRRAHVLLPETLGAYTSFVEQHDLFGIKKTITTITVDTKNEKITSYKTEIFR